MRNWKVIKIWAGAKEDYSMKKNPKFLAMCIASVNEGVPTYWD